MLSGITIRFRPFFKAVWRDSCPFLKALFKGRLTVSFLFVRGKCSSNILTQGLLKVPILVQAFFTFFLLQNQNYAHFSGLYYRKNYQKPINQDFSNYRQKYRYRFKTSSNYRRFEEIIGKVFVIEIDSKIIEKLSLSKKRTYRTPLVLTKRKIQKSKYTKVQIQIQTQKHKYPWCLRYARNCLRAQCVP